MLVQLLSFIWTTATLLVTTCSGISVAGNSANPIPITVLSGFLGSGKTTLLKRLLENDEGLKIAVIVNDMAEVNVDSKLVSTSMNAAGMVELQNGCACCSRSEELLSSVAELVTLSDMRDESFDHIVVELSGVADPKSIRSNFQEAMFYNMPLMERVRLDTMITMIDCSTFLDYLTTERTTSPDQSPELYPASQNLGAFGNLDSIIPDGVLQSLNPNLNEDNAISELLVAQTETADVLLLNKVDTVEESVVSKIEATAGALNPRARSFRTSYSAAPWKEVLGIAQGRGVVMAGVVDDHKDAVHAVTCTDPVCNDPTHTHSHNEHSNGAVDHKENNAHEHSHDHSHEVTNNGHSHDHTHEQDSLHGNIGSFVYRSRKPFHPRRLNEFLRHLPIKRGLPSSDLIGTEERISIDKSTQAILDRIVRSKGFAWLADSHVAALYWSQAGVAFEMTCLGSWWATLPRDQWPPEATQTILDDFDSSSHDESNDGCPTVGDRRQEIVFIGSQLSDPVAQSKVAALLDACVLTDSEWSSYVEDHINENKLSERFHSSLDLKIATY